MLPRVGSTMLCSLLEKTKVFGFPDEYLNPRGPMQMFASELHSSCFSDYWRKVTVSKATGNGVFSLKISYGDFHPLLNVSPLSQILPNARFIYLDRKDVLAQAISLQSAITSGVWHRDADGNLFRSISKAGPQYSRHALEMRIQELLLQKAQWESFFLIYNVEPLRIMYEDLEENISDTIRRCLDFIGVTSQVPVERIVPATSKLANEVNLAWYERFQSEHSL